MSRLMALVAVALVALPAAGQTRADRSAAQRLFQAGQDLYARGQYLDAASSFHAAYEKVPDASFLFNEARAYERGNALDRAIEAYEAYLSAAPDAPDVVEVERKVATLRQRLAARQGEEDAPEPEPGPAPEPSPDLADTTAPSRDFPDHAIGVAIGPVFWLEGADDQFRIAGEYRLGLSARTALAGQLMYVPPLVSGRTNASSGLGLAAFLLYRFPIFDPADVVLRAGLAFEAYSSRSASSQLLAPRAGPGLAWHLGKSIAVELDALLTFGPYFQGSTTLESEGSDTDLVLTFEGVASIVFAL